MDDSKDLRSFASVSQIGKACNKNSHSSARELCGGAMNRVVQLADEEDALHQTVGNTRGQSC